MATVQKRQYYVYILANENRTIYTGVTSSLARRVEEHRSGAVPGFTSQYGLNKLVYFEATPDAYSALSREKQIKSWTRAKRLALVAALNPNWDDLSTTLREGT